MKISSLIVTLLVHVPVTFITFLIFIFIYYSHPPQTLLSHISVFLQSFSMHHFFYACSIPVFRHQLSIIFIIILFFHFSLPISLSVPSIFVYLFIFAISLILNHDTAPSLSIYLYIYLFIYLYIYPSIYLSIDSVFLVISQSPSFSFSFCFSNIIPNSSLYGSQIPDLLAMFDKKKKGYITMDDFVVNLCIT